MIREQGNFMHPEYKPVLDSLPPKSADPFLNFSAIREIIVTAADEFATHPLVIAKELQLSRAKDVLMASEIENTRVSRIGYVGDIHGLTDADFTKLRETLVAGKFEQVFFLGDIGGSPKLAKLQKLFYNGSEDTSQSFLYNKARQLIKDGASEDNIIEATREGYLRLRSFEIQLESFGKKPEDEAFLQAQEEIGALSQADLAQRIIKLTKYGHYGHYVSDLPTEAVITLAGDVESYYERFSTMVAELSSRGVKSYAIQGNWDARLPFDFEKGTEKPVPLPLEKRRVNVANFFRRRMPYFTHISLVDSRDALHVMVPFDTVAKDLSETVGDKRFKDLKRQIRSARRDKKRIVLLAHAVPAWSKHTDKLPTGEGQATEIYLRQLIGELNPDEVLYGHEHAVRRDSAGNELFDQKYLIIRGRNGKVSTGENRSPQELSKDKAIVVSHLPIPSQNFNGVATTEITHLGDKRPRGAGGKQSPIRVGRDMIRHFEPSENLPSERILYVQGK